MPKTSHLSQLLTYAGHYRFLTYTSCTLAAVSALLGLTPFWYIWQIVRDILSTGTHSPQAGNLIHYGWMAVLFAVLSLLIYISGLLCSHLAAFRIAANIRIALIEHIARLPLGTVQKFGSGKLRKTITEASVATETYLAHQLPDKASAIATPIGLMLLLFVFDWRLGIFCLFPVVLSFAVLYLMTGPSMAVKMKEYQDALDAMSNEAVEYVRGIPVVKTFGQTVFSFEKFKSSIDRYFIWVTDYTKEMRVPMMLYTAAINSIFAFLIAAALLFFTNDSSTTFLLNLLFYIIITPIISVTLTRIMYQSENSIVVEDALERINAVLKMKPLSESAQPHLPANSSLTLKNVTYSYDGKKNAVENISLTILPGQTVAFVGSSGSGKTTLATLIARFFDPQKGMIEIGGVDLRHIPKKNLMETISFVFQDSRLIKASILENVRLGQPEASRADVENALRAAQCTDILEKLPQGIDTILGTSGVHLSGGEQQRIAIARAILKNAPIIILDEATAFSDPDNETHIQAALRQLTRGKTVILIAHRLSTVMNADLICVLVDGKLAESGSSTQLLQKGSLFASMWQDYQTSFQWKVRKGGVHT